MFWRAVLCHFRLLFGVFFFRSVDSTALPATSGGEREAADAERAMFRLEPSTVSCGVQGGSQGEQRGQRGLSELSRLSGQRCGRRGRRMGLPEWEKARKRRSWSQSWMPWRREDGRATGSPVRRTAVICSRAGGKREKGLRAACRGPGIGATVQGASSP